MASVLLSKVDLGSNSRVRRAAMKSSMGGSLWNAIFCQVVARVHATKASPSLLTQDEARVSANDATQPSCAV
eukprot:42184-Lingulodinium_polyedra.AAC.1